MKLRWWLLVLVLAGSAARAGDSLLPDGGFEEADPPLGWQLPPQAVFSVDRAMAAEGRRSLCYNNQAPDKPGPWSVSHPFVAPPAGLLRVSGQLRAGAFRGSVRASVYQANCYTGELQLVGESALLSSPQECVTTGWRPFSFLAAASPDGGRGLLRLTFRGTGQVWVDSLELTVAAPAGPSDARPRVRITGQVAVLPELGVAVGANLLEDSGFEGAGLPWCRLLNPKHAHGLVCQFDTREAYRGRGSARVTNYGASDTGPAGWAQRIQVPPGSDILLVGYARTREVRGRVYLRLDCWGMGEDGTPARLATATSAEIGGPGVQPWTRLVARLRVPEGTRFVDAACLLQGNGSAWFDEVHCFPVASE